ncbi:hypothetical protein AVEN_133354-1 [Araneus ventricosus]|uniref:Uncharacterized protein n=1 Tax=Araneus ventricosus TaxID=182803 RepID=A0A4Y2DK34_ARAVE|nr:hypothetical protein AVEN_133354-1 [Araneus ventricosus]
MNLTSDLPVSQRAYRTSATEEVEINKQVKNLLTAGLINPLSGSVFFLKRFEKRAAAEPLSILKVSSSQQKIFPKAEKIKSLPPSELLTVSNPLGGED